MHRRVITWLQYSIGIILVTTLAQGCATRGRIGGANTPDSISSVAAESQARLLNVQVSASPQGEKEASSVANSVKSAVEGKLAAKGFAVNDTSPDIKVALNVGVNLFDQSGGYYRYEGNVDASVQRTRDTKILGQTVVAAKGDRKLGQSSALQAVSGKLGADTADWVAGVATPLQSGLSANDITIKRPLLTRDDPAYVKMFVDTVGAIDGVLSCTLVSQNYGSKTMVFRVVYYKDSFPEGLLNRLATIQDLGIKPAM